MFDLLIKNAAVVTLDDAHHIYMPGFVAVKGRCIAAVGPMEALPEEAEAARTVDASGLAVMPGLVDAHGHAGHCLIKGMGEQSVHWINMAEEIYSQYTDDFFWYADGALAAAERLKFGITTACSMMGSYSRADRTEILGAHFDGSVKTGIRQFAGLGCSNPAWPKTIRVWEGETSRTYETTSEDAIRNTRTALKAYNGVNERQFCIVTPSSVGRKAGMSDEFSAHENRAMYELAAEFGVPIHTHAYGGDVEFLADTTPEILDYTTSLTHMTKLSGKEIDIMGEAKAYVFHGPTTRSVIRGWCPVYELLRKGAHVAIVTDGTAPDRSFDIWREMKLFQMLHRTHEHDTMLAPAGFVMELCTREPAKALGIGDMVGSLEAGKRADIITIDLMQPHLVPVSKELLVTRLVYHVQGQDVRDVWVDGEQVMADRKLLLTDERQLMADADRAFTDLRKRHGEEKFRHFVKNDGLYELRAQSDF